MFGRKKEPDPAKVAEREAMAARMKADEARAAGIAPRLKELDDYPRINFKGVSIIVAQSLADDEGIDGALFGNCGEENGLLVATSRRVLAFTFKLFGGGVESIDYSKITGVQQTRGLLHGDVTIAAGGSTVELRKAMSLRIPAFVETVQSNMRGGGRPADAPPPPAAGDPTEQLRKLAALRDDGILTEDEFTAKKRQLLGLE